MYDIEETRRGPKIHGHMTDGDKIVTCIAVIVFWPVGLLYWERAAKQADHRALQEYQRDQATAAK